MTASMPDFIDHITAANPHALQLDGTKIGWYRNRVEAWARIIVDALNRTTQ